MQTWNVTGEVEKIIWNQFKPEQLLVSEVCLCVCVCVTQVCGCYQRISGGYPPLVFTNNKN